MFDKLVAFYLKNQKLNTQILLPLEAMAKLLDINQG